MGSDGRTWNIVVLLLMLILSGGRVLCYQYKVGDLDAWNIPSSSNPNVYTLWASSHNLTIGDSLFFLYAPSQDSVIQVTRQSYNSCNIQDPILLMNNGNSLFNITKDGVFYFTSGVAGHCQKHQRLRISVGGNGSSSVDDDPAAPSPSYPTVFGSIPMAPSSPLTSSAATATSSFSGISSSSSSLLLLMSAATCLALI